ncbi:hypothetical protein HNO92_000463 [Chromobacterium alkanivorans]|uniref:DUF1484 family protein n=1 Tax=Chromobacterium alkanivorans TaxID=1071719 RepID=UPI00216A5C4F|nr:DUF1484 family protein [Chromobacterium alkanivorans]MCS3802813.1 hypothetical protein [Chromobacterium alkanivorans]MCS3817139.1 hypothetical protein [Chromobacterium alkanivorans]MCS3872179.1 hypothetical protein [Chromobacterium alkanivorans]
MTALPLAASSQSPRRELARTLNRLHQMRMEHESLALIDTQLAWLDYAIGEIDDAMDHIIQCSQALALLLQLLSLSGQAQLPGRTLWALLEPVQRRLAEACLALDDQFDRPRS